jgi:hypothetical protein
MHNAKFDTHMEGWKSTTNEIKSACGFCPSKFTTWSQRADHLAAHFRNGADMSQWANGWGFEPYVERLVENAIPPYLIGHERQTMDPYVARTVNGPKRNSVDKTGSTPSSGTGLTYGASAPDSSDELDITELDQMTRDSNCWGRLEQELGHFVTECKLNNTMPTDKQIQDRARMIIFEDDDPWNWTCADNQRWLDTFKFQQGIGGITPAMEEKKATLEEVPVLAPYVVRGGNKTAAKHSGNAAKYSDTIGKRMISGTIQDWKQRRNMNAQAKRGSWGNGQGIKGMAFGNRAPLSEPSSALPDLDPGMDLDFEGIDFQNLDLGMAGMGMDDVTMTPGSGSGVGGLSAADFSSMNVNSLPTTTGMSALTAGLAAADVQGVYAPVTQAGFGDLNLSTLDGQPLMSEQEMNELAKYSSSLH